MRTYELTRRLALRRRAARWRTAALGLFVLSLSVNLSTCGARQLDRRAWAAREARYQAQLQRAEQVRDQAVRALGALALSAAQEQADRAAQAAAYEAIGVWEYAGTCTVTAYCPCAACCGIYADGLTAAGLPAGPGVAAVDPAVIPLGSTLIIDGQQYLAADTGVTGRHVDLCMGTHRVGVALGGGVAAVWVRGVGAP